MSTATRTEASYRPHTTVPGGLTAELARLEAQAELTWDQEEPILRRLGLLGAGRLLDLGCGPGATLRRLAAASSGRGRLVGLDLDLDLLRRAARAAPGHPALVAARAGALPFADACFTGVLARYVLQHVADPLAVVREAARVLVPGGWLVCIDVDEQLWGLAHPASSGLDAVYRKAAAGQAARGGDRAVIRRLPRLLRAAGLGQVRVQPFAVTSDDRPLGDLTVHLAPDRLLPALSEGRIELAEYLRVSLAHTRLLSDPDAWVMLLGFAVIGQRTDPARPGRSPTGSEGNAP